MKKASILIPCYNEEGVLSALFESLEVLVNSSSDYQWELLFVNDGSTDRTLELIKNEKAQERLSIQYIDLSRNFGKEIAMMAGFDALDADCAIILDADLQDPPSLIPQMLALWEQGYEDVAAKRNAWPQTSFLKKISTFLFSKLLNRLSSLPIPENVGDFRLLDRACIEAMRSIRDKNRYTKGLYSWIGFRKTIIYYDKNARIGGKSKWNLFKLLNLATDAFTSFSIQPLRFSMYLGITSLAFSVFYFIFCLLTIGFTFSTNNLVLFVCFFIGGIQLVSIGILGEYIGRLFGEVKQRPPYIIREKSS